MRILVFICTLSTLFINNAVAFQNQTATEILNEVNTSPIMLKSSDLSTSGSGVGVDRSDYTMWRGQDHTNYLDQRKETRNQTINNLVSKLFKGILLLLVIILILKGRR
jgi:hypothetical protein